MAVEEVERLGEVRLGVGGDHLGTNGENLFAREVFEHHGDKFEQCIQPLRWRQLIDETHWTERATHTVTFVAVGTVGRPRIDLDALVVIR